MQATTSPYIYTDLSGLGQLKTAARENQQVAIKEIAKQFESLFMNMMLKSMRDASMGDPIFDSNQSMFYRDMFDSQLTLSMSKGRGLGLADTLARQLQQQIPVLQKNQESNSQDAVRQTPKVRQTEPTALAPGKPVSQDTFADTGLKTTAEPLIAVSYVEKHITYIEPSEQSLPVDDIIDDEPITAEPVAFQRNSYQSRQEHFVGELWPHAMKTADELDIDPEVLISQAALETGWGRHVIKGADGASSFNLFNIKAGQDWHGKTVEKLTLEYRGGVPIREKASFRAYDSYAESFKDYADLLQGRQRYQQALNETDNPVRYMQALQQAGYATDPNYADKVIHIMNREGDVFDKYSSLYEGEHYDV